MVLGRGGGSTQLWCLTPCEVTTTRLGEKREVFHKSPAGCEKSAPSSGGVGHHGKPLPFKHVHTSPTHVHAHPQTLRCPLVLGSLTRPLSARALGAMEQCNF